MFIFTNLLQFEKDPLIILFNVLGSSNVTSVKLVQFAKAPSNILTSFPIVIFCNLEKP